MRDRSFEKWLKRKDRQEDKAHAELLRALGKSVRVSEEVALRKFELGVPIIDRQREEEMLRKAKAQAKRAKLDGRTAVESIEFVLQVSKEAQRKRLYQLRARKWF